MFSKSTFLTLLLFSTALIGRAQEMNKTRIKNLGDSTIISHIGQQIFQKYFVLQNITQFQNSTRYSVYYLFKWNKFGSDMSYITSINFDSNYVYLNTTDFSFVPDYMIKNQPCDFLSRQKAKHIIENISRTKLKNKDVIFVFDDNHICFTWTSFIPFEKNDLRLISINAITGKTVENKLASSTQN